jgi:hypothetical protein
MSAGMTIPEAQFDEWLSIEKMEGRAPASSRDFDATPLSKWTSGVVGTPPSIFDRVFLDAS